MLERENQLTSEQEWYRLTEFFKVLGDPNRIKIIFQISEEKICVGEIAKRLCVSESAVSHHLQVLKMNGLVTQKREGKSIFYELSDDHVHSILKLAIEHATEERRTK